MGSVTQTMPVIPSGSAKVDLSFLDPNPPPETPLIPGKFPVDLEDVRGRDEEFDLDTHGFQFLKGISTSVTPEEIFNDEKKVTEQYYPEVEQLLLRECKGAHRVVIFDHTIRRSLADSSVKPVQGVHIDQTVKSTIMRTKMHLGDDAEELLKGRVRLINLWRPLNAPVEIFPLAVADFRYASLDQLVPMEGLFPDRRSESAGVKYKDGMKWYYWSAMTNDERIILQISDNRSDTIGLHTSFEDPRTPEGARPRESIELRALVFG